MQDAAHRHRLPSGTCLLTRFDTIGPHRRPSAVSSTTSPVICGSSSRTHAQLSVAPAPSCMDTNLGRSRYQQSLAWTCADRIKVVALMQNSQGPLSSTLHDWSPDTSLLASGISKPHARFFFDDGNVIMLVENVRYQIHKFFFNRDSAYFASRLATISLWNPFVPPSVALPDVTVAEFDAFLSILYPSDFDKTEISSVADWTAVLRLATMWGFTSIVNRAIRHLDTLTSPLDKLVLARAHRVERWVVPALVALCERPECLNLEDVRRMTLEDIVLVGRLRESVRDAALKVSPEDVRTQVEAALLRKPSTPTKDQAVPAKHQSLPGMDALSRAVALKVPKSQWRRTTTRPESFRSRLWVLETGDPPVPQGVGWGSVWGQKVREACERGLGED
ncbi:hypothetical protein FA95DRAFT_117333 [Auriscalpium vulgare]|uniref:Uncharacterized protein n=1 Tax=Auriscalpium vulgare TaxID=40419 RepID=A0ACB8RPT7_9AGAM|nr:hypothetical protein FA95DRAFT_117333 [Auriscalpium vulgare]